jgi:hypothetical protein
VALSRAKNGLVIIGSKDMREIKYSTMRAKIWAEVVRHHLVHGSLGMIEVDGQSIEKKLSMNQFELQKGYHG